MDIFGDKYLIQSWLRYAQYVEGFPLQEERLDRRHKDLPLVLKATEKLIENVPQLQPIIEKYRKDYTKFTKLYATRDINIIEYHKKTAQMVSDFITEVKTLPLNSFN